MRPSSPRLSTVSERGHAPGLTRAQTAYLKRLLADPLSQQDNDPLIKLRAANSGEDVPAAGPSRTGLEQSLAAFTAVEVLEGENGYACKKCWKIKAGKYKATHPTVMEEDETLSPATFTWTSRSASHFSTRTDIYKHLAGIYRTPRQSRSQPSGVHGLSFISRAAIPRAHHLFEHTLKRVRGAST